MKSVRINWFSIAAVSLLLFISSFVLLDDTFYQPNSRWSENFDYDAIFIDYSIPDSVEVNSFYLFNMTIKNMDTEKWNRNCENPVYISYHWLKDGAVVV